MAGYKAFRQKYATGAFSTMQQLHHEGQKPPVMVVSCCDSRVDPAILLQCDPGDLFVLRNIANIIPPCETDALHHGTSAALEFGVNVLQVKHLIILGHSQCGGIKSWMDRKKCKCVHEESFVDTWVSGINVPGYEHFSADECSKFALYGSYKNALTFPWISEKVHRKELMIHLWFFDIKTGEIEYYDHETARYKPLQ